MVELAFKQWIVCKISLHIVLARKGSFCFISELSGCSISCWNSEITSVLIELGWADMMW